MILYVSESGGIVTKEYSGTPAEEAQNLAAAKIVADVWGCIIALLEPQEKLGVKSADAAIYWRGSTTAELWEIKTNRTGTKNSVNKSLRKASKQSTRMLLHITAYISERDLFNGINGRIRLTNLQEIAIIRHGNIERYTRQDILNMFR